MKRDSLYLHFIRVARLGIPVFVQLATQRLYTWTENIWNMELTMYRKLYAKLYPPLPIKQEKNSNCKNSVGSSFTKFFPKMENQILYTWIRCEHHLDPVSTFTTKFNHKLTKKLFDAALFYLGQTTTILGRNSPYLLLTELVNTPSS